MAYFRHLGLRFGLLLAFRPYPNTRGSIMLAAPNITRRALLSSKSTLIPTLSTFLTTSSHTTIRHFGSAKEAPPQQPAQPMEDPKATHVSPYLSSLKNASETQNIGSIPAPNSFPTQEGQIIRGLPKNTKRKRGTVRLQYCGVFNGGEGKASIGGPCGFK